MGFSNGNRVVKSYDFIARPAAEPVLKSGGEALGKEGVVCIVIALEQSDTSESGNLQDGHF